MVTAVLSFIFGLIFLILGGTATLSNFGISLIALPGFLYNPMITKFALLIGGILLFIDSFSIKSFQTWMPSSSNILLGILTALLGAFPLALDYNLLSFMPFIIKFTIPPLVLSAILTLFGLYLCINCYRIYRSSMFMGR